MLANNYMKNCEISTISSNYKPTIFYYNKLRNNNKENQVQEILFELVDIINSSYNQTQDYHILIQVLYNILQNSNILIKCNFNTSFIFHNIPKFLDQTNIIKLSTTYNYLFIMNNKIILQFNNNIIENLLKDNEKLKYLLCHLNLVQDIPNQALYISNDRLDSNLIKKNMLKSVKDKKLIDYPVLIHNINLSNNINPFKSLDKRNESLRKRKFSIKKNRKINGRKLLEKKEKFYNMYSNNYFIAKKKEINKGKTLNYIYGKNINIKKMNTKRNSFY
eukprot:jgi/Orpsp1_1/1192172/evm.model.d7180000091076.1